jgi:O2-independent ubiquinone biosynthesis accessory factor UbiT
MPLPRLSFPLPPSPHQVLTQLRVKLDATTLDGLPERVLLRLLPLVRHLPAWPPAWLIARLFTLGVWPHLGGAMDAVLRQRCIAVRVTDLGVVFHFRIEAAGLVAVKAGAAEVTFSGTAIDLLKLALRSCDPDALFFNRRLLIEGDTDLGLRIKNMLDGIEIEPVIATLPVGLRQAVQHLRGRLLAEAGV